MGVKSSLETLINEHIIFKPIKIGTPVMSLFQVISLLVEFEMKFF